MRRKFQEVCLQRGRGKEMVLMEFVQKAEFRGFRNSVVEFGLKYGVPWNLSKCNGKETTNYSKNKKLSKKGNTIAVHYLV